MSDQAMPFDNISAEDFAESIGGVESRPSEALGEHEPFSKGFAEVNTDIRNGLNYITSMVPRAGMDLEWKDGGLTLLDSDDMYGEAFSNPLVSPQVRRDIITARKDAQLLRDYWGTRDDEDGGLRLLGNLAGYLSTPTTLAPVGKGVKAGMAIGGTLAGTEAALEGLAAKGEIDPKTVGAFTLAGMGLGGIFGATGARAGKEETKRAMSVAILDGMDDQMILNPTGKSLKGYPDVVTSYGSPRDPRQRLTLQEVRTHNNGKRRRMKKDLDKLNEKLKRGARITKKGGGESYLDGAAGRKLSQEQAQLDVQRVNVIHNILRDPQVTRIINEDSMGRPARSAASEAANIDGRVTAREAIDSGNVQYDSSTGNRMDPTIKEVADLGFEFSGAWYENTIKNVVMGKWLTRPSKVLENYGPGGKRASEMMTSAENASSYKISKGILGFGDALTNHGITDIEGANLVTDLIRKVVKPEDVSPATRAAAKDVVKIFEDILGEARKTNVLTEEGYNKLLISGRERGYWPRVYDQDFINTTAGKKQWEEALVGTVFTSREAAERAVRSLVGDTNPDSLESLLKQIAGEDGTKTFHMTRSLARKIWKDRGRHLKDKRSSHLENARHIPAELEEALTPFLVRSPEDVMASYLQDVHGRIEYARVFGANDEVARVITTELRNVQKEVGDMFNESYHQAVRSTGSKNVQSFIEQPDATKKIVGSLKAFENLKLLFSPVVNSGQAIVNGSAASQALLGVSPVQGYTNTVKALIKGLRVAGGNRELKREFALSGAGLHTTIMQSLGGMDQGFHTIFQRKFTGALAPLEFFNNPTTFLKNIGFFKVEEFNRSMGYFLGRAQAQSLIENKIKLLRMGTRASPKKMAKIDKGLKALGLNPDVAWDLQKGTAKYSTQDMAVAGQTFANEINFVNNSVTLPAGLNSFYGKLFSQFQSFSFHQGYFIRDKLIKPLKGGNPLPLMTYLGVGTPVGMTLVEFKKFLMGDDEESTGMKYYLTVLSHFGGVGIAFDALKSAYHSPMGAAGVVVGPAISDVSEILSSVIKSTTSSIDKGEIDLSPFLKGMSKSMVYPYKKELLKGWEEDKHFFGKEIESAFEDNFESNF